MTEDRLKIFNGKIISPSGIFKEGTILVESNKIIFVGQSNVDFPGANEINAKGNYISPGFIDIHVHGGGGHDFMDATEEAFLKIAETHAQYGTTSMLPTTLTGSKKQMTDLLAVYEKVKSKNTTGSQFLGVHLEGPYLAMNQKGAQDPKYIRNPDPAEYKEIIENSGSIKRWSAAPELPGSIEFGRYIRSKGILPAMAHTDAVYEEAEKAFRNGYTLVTHFYSAMSGVTRRNAFRYAGVVEAGYLIDEMDVEIIADGVHLPSPLLKLVYKIKGPERTALITDAIRAAAMPPGEYVLGNKDEGIKIISEDGVAKLPDRSSFAGSIATANRLVRTVIDIAEIPLYEAVRMITATPARIIGVSDYKGEIAVGKDADMVIFDDSIDVIVSINRGHVIYKKLNYL